VVEELRSRALSALGIAEPAARCAAVGQLANFEGTVDCETALAEPAGIPARPARPLLVAPAAVAQRSVGTAAGRAALLHALAHIEFNAIGLALDHVWRFAGLPEAYYRDWVGVAVEEAGHFGMLRGRLVDAGYDYGDFAAHDGLWEMARRTADDPLARMALVPRTLEARGLDASPAVRAKFAAAGDHESARVVELILRDEIGHVAIGNRWFRFLCEQRGVDPMATYRQLAQSRRAPPLRGPFNVPARRQAGFTEQEIDELQRSAR
jgi:uncharacterized ferritin-like protein (DUF455 family)